MVVGEIGPMDGFERGVSKKPLSVEHKLVGWLGKSSELEVSLRGDEPHALVCEVATTTKHGDGGVEWLCEVEEVFKSLFIECDVESGSPIMNERHEGVSEVFSSRAISFP